MQVATYCFKTDLEQGDASSYMTCVTEGILGIEHKNAKNKSSRNWLPANQQRKLLGLTTHSVLL